MKKTLVSALTTALVVGAASTTFAAANPFEDVPADHWAYDAIAQLAADGVIEGYGDGTYRGDQEITRYEMAQMVARAMAKGGGDKALIDKLAAEFADELNNLGVRVAALEKKVDNVKWRGQITYRYSNTQRDNDGADDPPGHENFQHVRLRFEPEMQINKHWSGHARIDYNSDMNSAKNSTGGNNEIERGGPNEFQVERMWVQGDYNNFQIMLGKLPYLTNIDNGMFFDDNVSGGQITVGSNVKATLTIGRTQNLGDFGPIRGIIGDPVNETASYQAIEIYNDRDSKFTWGVGYHRVLNKAVFNDYYAKDFNPLTDTAENDKDTMNVWNVGLGYQITDTLNLNGAFAWNTSEDEKFNVAGGDEINLKNLKRAWTVELDYKGADETDAGSWGAYAAYRQLGRSAVLAPTYDAVARGEKGWEVGFDYVPMKNFLASFKYFRGQQMEIFDGQGSRDTQRFYTELNFFF